MKRRFVSFLLAACMLLALLPTEALAAEADSDSGDASAPPADESGSEEQGEDLYPEISVEEIPAEEEHGEESAPVDELPDEAYEEAELYAGGTPYPVTGGNLYFNPSTGAVTGCDPSVTEAVIPSVIEDQAVTAIGASAFSGCTGLTSIVLPDSVTSIGNNAFFNCSSLSSCTFPNRLTSIGSSAFQNCKSLTSVELPEGTLSIERHAFYNCTNLTSVKLPDSLTSIGASAFLDCSSLGSVAIPTGVASVEPYMFSGCKNLTSVTIPGNVAAIGDYAFRNCTNLASITLAEGVTSIGQDAFSACKNLTAINFPASVLSIEREAFYGCASLSSATFSDGMISIGDRAFQGTVLTSLTLPDSLTSIGNEAFKSCSSLTSLTLSNKLESIGSDAFSNCTSLTAVTIPHSVLSIGKNAFYNCSGLTSLAILDGVTTIGNSAFSLCTGLTFLTLPDSTVSIGDSVFWGCTSLASIKLPARVDSMGKAVFYNCSSLAEVTIPTGTTELGTRERGFFEGCSNLESVHLPDGLAAIGSYAFRSCGSLTSLTLPDSVTSIGSGVFSGCTGLTSIKLPARVDSMGESVFYRCSSLTEVTIPAGTTTLISNSESDTSLGSLSHGFFEGCSQLQTVRLPDSITAIGKKAFYKCTSLTSVNLPYGLTSIGPGAFDECTSLTSIQLPGSLTSIGPYAFNSCGELVSINLPDGLTRIDYYAFSSCGKLTSLELPSSLTYIGGGAFSYCPYAFTSVTIPNGITFIDDYTFNFCTSLTSVVIPDSVTSIGGYAFSNCANLASVTLSDRLAAIGEAAFLGCALTAIDLPNSLTSIGTSAFAWNANLRGITLPNSLASIGSAAFNGCESLISMEIPAGVTSLPNSVFSKCTSLQTVKIPETVTYIDKDFLGSNWKSYPCIYYSGSETQWRAIEGGLDTTEIQVLFNSYTPASPPTPSLSLDETYAVRWKDSNALAAVFSMKGIGGGVSGTASWTSSDPSVFRLASPTSGSYRGLETSFEIRGSGLAIGTSEITITAGDLTRTFTVQVKEGEKTRLSSTEDAEIQHREKNIHVGEIKATGDPDFPATLTVTSSNTEVFQLNSPGTRTFAGSTTLLISGTGLSVGTATVRVSASDGASTSFTVTVTEAKSVMTLSGPRELNCDGASPADNVKKSGSIRCGIKMGSNPPDKCTWTTSDPGIVAFSADGTKTSGEMALHKGSAEEVFTIPVYAIAPKQEKKATITCTLPDGTSQSWTIKVFSNAERKLKELAANWAAAYSQYDSAVEQVIKEASKNAIEPETLGSLGKKLESKLESTYGIVIAQGEKNEESTICICKALLEMMAEQLVTECVLGNVKPDSEIPANIVKAVAAGISSSSYTYNEQDENRSVRARVNISMFGAFGAKTGQGTYTYYTTDGKQKKISFSFNSSLDAMEKITEDFMEDLLNLKDASQVAALRMAEDELCESFFGKSLKALTVRTINEKIAKHLPVFKELLLGNVPEMVIECKEYYDTAADCLMQGDLEKSSLDRILAYIKTVRFSDDTIGKEDGIGGIFGQRKNNNVKQAVKAMEDARKALESALDEYIRTGTISDKKTGLKSIFMCPVEVKIYKEGTQIGLISDEEETYCNDANVTIEQTAEVKTLYYSEPLTFKVIGTDYGTLNCTFEETVNGEVTQRTNYYDIPLYKGKEIEAVTTAPVTSENGTTTSGTVAVATGNESVGGETISATLYGENSVQIDCPDAAGGSTMGTGSYVAGDPVRLVASAESGYRFMGWMDTSGNLVCITPVYEFTARESMTLTPIFAETVSTLSEEEITVVSVTVTGDSSTVVLKDPDSVLQRCDKIFAALYANGRMERVLAGTLSGNTVTFSGNLNSEWSLFILDSRFAPICARLSLKESMEGGRVG